ncbi:fasciclin domain-containing protein [Algibacter mikhailovii]|uniref:fasciclin domain-containing protein n=1 Tax=Algibacter mikhailovii TaxID=425498 RepID=UPI002494361E|nr:fasciclin domain-containing protein [Algibacter mikhailovii]
MAIFIAITTIGCNDDAWEAHYEQLDARLENNLLSILSDKPEYSDFVDLLKKTGYDEVLKTPQAYTVWAPNNDALAKVSDDVLNDPDLLEELIGNHISRFSYNTNGIETPALVKMFNDKYIEFSNTDGTIKFGEVDVIQKDILAANGILHIVSEVLNVSPNIWGYLNENEARFPTLMNFYNQYNEIVFDQENSIKVGTNSLGQTVYDSVFVQSNSYFKTIGDLSSEEERFTFIGLTDDVYNSEYDVFKEFYAHKIEDSTKANTDKAIFSNINFPVVNKDELDGSPITTTTGNSVVLDPNTVLEDYSLSNGNLFVVNDLNYNPKDVIYKPIRYEIENSQRIEVGSLSDFTMQSVYDKDASGEFISVVSLLANPDRNEGNNYFEIAFANVLSADYTLNLKFVPIGAQQQTKLKFEISYRGLSGRNTLIRVPAIVVDNQEDAEVKIGETYSFPVFVNNEMDNEFFVKLKVYVDVSEPELILYGRRIGIDYAELVPVD